MPSFLANPAKAARPSAHYQSFLPRVVLKLSPVVTPVVARDVPAGLAHPAIATDLPTSAHIGQALLTFYAV
jgi:hypothetical protein